VTVDRDRILSVLREKQAEIENRYGMRMIGIIGSVARGEARSDSDVDVFVDIVRTPTLLEIAGAELELQDEIGLPFDFVFREGLKPTTRARMERDLVLI
jgi:predicted nucleotidyltransferase